MLDLGTVDTLSQILCWGQGTSWVLQAVEQHPSFPTANTLPPAGKTKNTSRCHRMPVGRKWPPAEEPCCRIKKIRRPQTRYLRGHQLILDFQ